MSALFPTRNEFLDGWTRSTVRSLLSYGADEAVISEVFGNQVVPYIRQFPHGVERTYAEAFYGDFHHPNREFAVYTTPLMHRLPFDFLMNHLTSAGSYRSWMDLREVVRRPEFTLEVLEHLQTLSEMPQDNLSLEDRLRIPSPAIVQELRRLVGLDL
jgi:hypothetical protein